MAIRNDNSVLMEHSRAKVQLLGEYLESYLNILAAAGFTDTINIFDLFCGIGEYEDGGHGSPLIILNAVKKCWRTTDTSIESLQGLKSCLMI